MTIKERLYSKALRRELEDKYDDGRYGENCRACGAHPVISEGILIYKHSRRCPTGQLERILSI